MTTTPPASVPAHPDDLLVVGWLKEAVDHPQFKESQVFSSNSVQAFYGRSPRRIYYTPEFWATPRALECYEVLKNLVSRRQDCELVPISQYGLL